MSGLNAFSSPGGAGATNGTSALTANTTPVQPLSGGRGQS